MEFTDLKLSEKTLKSIKKHGYEKPTEVQEKAIPKIIDGKNLIVRSQTGTGKTSAFGIGLVERIIAGKNYKSLILAPTRELALQVCEELRAISRMHKLNIHSVYGGQSINTQIQNLRKGYDIIVATPGRLLDLYRRKIIKISEFDAVVLDEADHMLDLGFQDEVLAILDKLPKERIMLLFSATIDESIRRIANKYMPASEVITIGEIKVVSTISEEHIEVTQREKFAQFLKVLNSNMGIKILVFMKTKRGVAWLKEMLERRGFKGVDMLQGDMSQAQRTRVLEKFRNDRISVLIATNVAARGLHIDDVGLIINYDEAETEETHLHRVGRTGRMGAEGKVVNFVPRKESLKERMSPDHPDFDWMKKPRNTNQSQNNRSKRGKGRANRNTRHSKKNQKRSKRRGRSEKNNSR